MVIGLTVVSVGTSLPELAIGISSVRHGDPELALGNIIGTNLVNILLVLGLSALLATLTLERRTLRIDLPAMAGATILLLFLARDRTLTTADGLWLLGYACGYLALTLVTARIEARRVAQPTDPGRQPTHDDVQLPSTAPPGWRTIGLLVLGMVLIIVGAELLVDGATELAQRLGASDTLIGLTVVAIGTSAPELVTTIVSTLRGDRALAIGNLLGSSVLNIALILGVTLIASPGPVSVPEEIFGADLILLVATALLCIPIFRTGRRITRVEGGFFVALYVGYLTWLLTTRL